MKEWFVTKKNIIIFSVIFLLIVALIAMSIVINDRTYRLSQKTAELETANGTISEYSSKIEEHEKKESDLQSEIENIQGENAALKKKLTELAAKKAASEAAKKASNKTSTPQKTLPALKPNPKNDEAAKQRVKALTEALSFPKIKQEPEKPKVCYLTFDDGPSKNTPAILDILKKYNVKATFFVIGTGDFNLLPRIKAEGHAIGLHSYSHRYSAIYTGVEAYLSDLLDLSKKVEAKTGDKVNLLRFPGGSSNTVSAKYKLGIMTELSIRMPNMGYSYFDWNVSSGDADKALASKQEIVDGTVKRSTGKTSLCILMHDAAAKTTTVEALPDIIVKLKQMGYTFAPLTATTYGYHQHVNN